MASTPPTDSCSRHPTSSREHDELRLSKRLCYLLRYGAEKEGLVTSEEGFVELSTLMKLRVLRHNSSQDLLQLVNTSVSHRGVQRFQVKLEHGRTYIRATYGRRMERSPYHEGTKVTRLMQVCINQICNHLDDYDLSSFPDEFLITTMIHKMRREQRLTAKAWRTLLVPTLEHLDLGSVYLTEGTLKLVGPKCQNLRVLNMRECGYIATDHVVTNLAKKLSRLESLNLSGCNHLTDLTLVALSKKCPNLQHLNLSQVPLITQEGVLKFLPKAKKLQHLDVSDNTNFNEDGLEALAVICQEQKVNVILEGLDNTHYNALEDNPSLTLALASVSKYF